MLISVIHDSFTKEITTPQVEMTLFDLIGFGDVMQSLTEVSLDPTAPHTVLK